MPKLLLITSDYEPAVGGVARYYHGLSHELKGELMVLTDVVGEGSAQVLRVSWSWPVWPRWLPLLWLVPYYKTITKVQLLAAGQVLPIGTALLLARLAFGFRYLVFAHGLDLAAVRISRWKAWLARQVLRRAEVVVVNSNFTKELAVACGAHSDAVIRVYPGLTPLPRTSSSYSSKLKQRHGLDKAAVVLTVGRLVKRKGVDTLVTAITELAKRGVRCTCVIIGDGPERSKLEQLAQDIAAPVRFLGRVDDNELAAWYQMCQVFALVPEQSMLDPEGFGMVYLEAQAAGTPVIGSPVGGVPEAVGTGGVLVSSRKELEAALEQMLGDEGYRRQLGEQGRARVAREFTWERQAATLKQWIYEYLKRTSSR